MWLYRGLWLLLCVSGSQLSDDVETGSGEMDVTLDPERECQPIDLAFVMDSSGSINDDNPDNFDKMKTFLIDMVQTLPRMIGPGPMDNRIAAVTYSAKTYKEFTFREGTDPLVVEDLIDGIRYRGSETNIAGGMEMALDELFVTSAGDRPGSADVIVLITDGKGNRRAGEEVFFAEKAKARNISIITVGITDKVNRERLNEMATEGAFVMIDNFDVLQTMTQTILLFACKPLEMTTTTSTSTTTMLPETTTAGEALLCGAVNLVLLLDTSESVTTDLEDSKMSVLRVLDLLHNEDINVKLFTFSDTVQMESDGMDSMSDMMNKVKPSYGRTDLASSLDFVHKHGFDMTDSEDPTNILLVVTDGYSNMNKHSVLKMATNLKNDDVHITTVSVSEHVNMEILQEISSTSTVHRSESEDYREEVVTEMIQASCQVRAEPCERLDLVFLADSSSSINDMSPGNFQLAKNFITNFASLQDLGRFATQIGMGTFSSYGRYEFFLDEGRNLTDIRSMVAGVRYLDGMTNTKDGIKVANSKILHGPGSRPNAQKVLVLITDGFTEEDMEEVAAEVNILKKKGVYVLTAGYPTGSDNEYLRYLSSNSQVLQVTDHMGLNSVVQDLMKAGCKDQNTCRGRDVLFVADSSWSMTDDQEEAWNKTLEFVKEVAGSLEIEASHGSQVSVITFSTHGRIEFSLKEGTTKTTVMDLIDGIEYKGGKTNMADGLEMARQQMGSEFDRTWAKDVIVLLTNGQANERADETDGQAMKAREGGAYVIGVGVTDQTDKEQLQYISDVVYTTPDFSGLKLLVADVVTSICTGPR